MQLNACADELDAACPSMHACAINLIHSFAVHHTIVIHIVEYFPINTAANKPFICKGDAPPNTDNCDTVRKCQWFFDNMRCR
jgi:hypothetical protein